MEDKQILAFGILAAIVVAIFIYTRIKEAANLKRAATGEDMALLRQAVEKALPGQSGYEVAYAHWEDVEYYGRTRRTTYHHYALAFDDTRLWIMPLNRDGNVLRTGSPYPLTKDALGKIEVDAKRKDGAVRSLTLTLLDKDGKSPIHLDLDVENTRIDRFHPVNILQQEACEQFESFITALSDTVARENAGIEERMNAEAVRTTSKSAKTLGILGIVFCWTGFVGLIFGGIGLFMAPKPSQTGGKAAAPFILCLVGTLLSALVMLGGILAIALL